MKDLATKLRTKLAIGKTILSMIYGDSLVKEPYDFEYQHEESLHQMTIFNNIKRILENCANKEKLVDL